MRPPDPTRTIRELEARMRRLYRLIERLGIELDHATDELSRVRMCLANLEPASSAADAILVAPPAMAVKPAIVRRPRPASPAADPAPREIGVLHFIRKLDGSALLVLRGDKPGTTRHVSLPTAPAELFEVLATDDGRPGVGDWVSAKPNADLQRRLRTRSGKPLSYGALRQRVCVLRRHLVERGLLHPDVIKDATVGGAPGYSVAVRRR